MGSQNTTVHFGVKLIKKKYSFSLLREEFALINTKPSFTIKFKSLIKENAYINDKLEYTVEWCERYRKLCLEHFDYNMKYFEALSSEEFNKTLNGYLQLHKNFREVFDLCEMDNVEGYYIMVLDKYKQVYIGKSDNIKRRIQQHWSRTKPFDRTLFPMYNVKSVFSIDFFRALDTSRIFVYKTSLKDGTERQLIENFPDKFLCNRIGGDAETGIDALSTMNIRL